MRIQVLAIVGVLATACGSSNKPATQPEPVAVAEPAKPASSSVPELKKKSARDVLTGDGKGAVFMLSLADSPGTRKALEETCAKKAAKDEKKLAACKKDGEAQLAAEGIRIEKDAGADLWVWTAFGKDKGKDVTFSTFKFKIVSDAEGKVTLAPDPAPKGGPAEATFELPDEHTLVIDDDKKGKILYKTP
jgi:hypothetical protein